MSSKRVLVIEDDASLMRLYSKILSDYTVISCFSIDDARELLEQETFDAIICDIQIGTEHATSLLEENYLQWQQDNVIVAVISSREGYRAACEEMGIPFLLKPVERKALLAVIEGTDAT
jgi:DNA-binding NtrC family response regulator